MFSVFLLFSIVKLKILPRKCVRHKQRAVSANEASCEKRMCLQNEAWKCPARLSRKVANVIDNVLMLLLY